MKKKEWLDSALMLFILLRKIRREGLMAIEMDIELPQNSKFFHYIDDSYHPYISDICRLMIGGNLEPKDLDDYCWNMMAGEPLARQAVFNFIRLVLVSCCKGYAPQVAIEFGRSVIPKNYRPSFLEMEDYLRVNRPDYPEKDENELKLALAHIMLRLRA